VAADPWKETVLKTIMLAGAASLAFAASTVAQPLPTGDFIKVAAQTDDFERQEGRLAEKGATSPKVCEFGHEMVTAHTKTTAGLKVAIAKAGLPPPHPPMLTPEQAQNIATLKELHGPAFDKAYIGQQIHAHQTALSVMQAYAASGDKAPIRKAAANTVPIVQHHLEMAQALR
jgi:putative membrane protein